jgi:hypothetical protein
MWADLPKTVRIISQKRKKKGTGGKTSRTVGKVCGSGSVYPFLLKKTGGFAKIVER